MLSLLAGGLYGVWRGGLLVAGERAWLRAVAVLHCCWWLLNGTFPLHPWHIT